MYRLSAKHLLGTLVAVTLFVSATGCGDDPVSLDESGELVVEDLNVGEGEVAESGDRIAVHAIGTLEDGQVFFDSHSAEQPIFWELGQPVVLQGWTDGLEGMRVGGTRRLTLPPRLAYGVNPPNGVPVNATVTFEIELLDVNDPGALSIIDLEMGDGAVAEMGDTLTVNYVGKLGNGRTFDSSANRGPFEFTLEEGGLIAGWVQGVEGMRVGGTRRLIIPPELGYGAQGSGQNVPPNATLLFDVALLEVAKGTP